MNISRRSAISLAGAAVIGCLLLSLTAGAAVEKPIVIRLGIHHFGRTASGSVVARAAADQVGWQLPNGDVGGFGPQTFLVGKDRSIWLDDGLNNRLLVYRAGRAGVVARVVPLGFATADSSVALGPAGSIYTTRFLGNGRDHNYRLVLDHQTAAGKLIWETRLPSFGTGSSAEFCGALQAGPGGTLYCIGPHETWIPVATAAGAPIPPAEQRRATGPEPVGGGLRLVSHEFAPIRASHSVGFSLTNRRGSVVWTWRIFSRSAITDYRALAVVSREPVVLLDIQHAAATSVAWDYVVLRLGSGGTVPRVTLRHAVYGDNLLPDVRRGPDGAVYQLASSPKTGVGVSRYSLGR
jgi:hypothetical protein